MSGAERTEGWGVHNPDQELDVSIFSDSVLREGETRPGGTEKWNERWKR